MREEIPLHRQNFKSLMLDTLTGLDCKVYIRTLLNEHSVLSSASRKLRCADHSASASRLLPPPFRWKVRLGVFAKFDHQLSIRPLLKRPIFPLPTVQIIIEQHTKNHLHFTAIMNKSYCFLKQRGGRTSKLANLAVRSGPS